MYISCPSTTGRNLGIDALELWWRIAPHVEASRVRPDARSGTIKKGYITFSRDIYIYIYVSVDENSLMQKLPLRVPLGKSLGKLAKTTTMMMAMMMMRMKMMMTFA